ncbi:serine hydrolase domain-containing protein [Aspergillus clavatus NRRL 1]|uniref:Beta-lactamase, putative n=1 Tax=Aspergillus clavatus (strain ATCC 1007 / CBS 513.65 / DSM 816 / NCTC 3887 / NRRL 1 / QM 1276 / 107) TaxID=344612 RepID=A1CC20_ASPCL|nr:beta-lactamase, putative [Aspergillus clavatus NRRL 1]EAW13288.1 beta-lactamase, putative [Aspergillus clavatus NRRL 1]
MPLHLHLLWLFAITTTVTSTRPSDTLRFGSPESVGLLSAPLRQLTGNITGYQQAANYGPFTQNEVHPIEPSSAVIVSHDHTIVSLSASGMMSLYADANGTVLPVSQQLPARTNTIYDLASLTKLFTTIAALRQIDAGSLALNATVASYLPGFAVHGKESITVLMLLTHTSGFAPDPEPPLYDSVYRTVAERKASILDQSLQNSPGSTYLYSDLNFMSLALVLEHITHKNLDELVYGFTHPLGMHDTFFNRGNVDGAAFAPYARMAAEEFQIQVLGSMEPKRPQPVRGTVHDENAWALDGVSGHAGLFSTVEDTAILCQMILNNGTYGGHRILSPEVVDLIFHNFNERFPGDEHGLGFELNQYYTAGPMASLQTAGHTGFTGTTLVIDRPSNTFFLLFANRVHPNRNWSSNNIAREALGYWVAKSLGRDVPFPPL